MKKKIFFKTLMAFILILTFNIAFPCYCYALQSNAVISEQDKILLTDQASWMKLSEKDQMQYAMKYIPIINNIMGIPKNTFPAKNIHIMSPDDPAYYRACAYTDYGTKQIYINMPKTNETNVGGWALIYALAHETRHLYQSKYNTIPYNPDSTIDNMDIYHSDAREADANVFATCFLNYILQTKDWR